MAIRITRVGAVRADVEGLPHAANNPPDQSAHWPASEFGGAPMTVDTKGQTR